MVARYLAIFLLIVQTQLCYAADKPENLISTFDEHDTNLPHIPVTLVPVVSGVEQPTDIQFFPGSNTQMLVLEKTGAAKIFALSKDRVVSTAKIFFSVDVDSDSEMGLLGLAFHPNYAQNKYIFIN